jgi:uncharacterized membrane protein
MLPVLFLLTTFFIARAISRHAFAGKFSPDFVGRLAMSVMLVVTGLSHFFKTEAMIQSMPEMLPFKKELVIITGFIELAAAIGILLPGLIRTTSVLLIVFFILILPVNIVGSLKRVDLGGMENGAAYLWFRIPLQCFFIWWVYYFGVKRRVKKTPLIA